MRHAIEFDQVDAPIDVKHIGTKAIMAMMKITIIVTIDFSL